jgi:hypothetical protein
VRSLSSGGGKIGLLDALEDDITMARGIEAAIYGIGLDTQDDEMREGVLRLHQAHIGRLEEIKGRFCDLFALNRRPQPVGEDDEG